MAQKRIANEFEELQGTLGTLGVVAQSIDAWTWHIFFPGADGTPYQGGTFCFQAQFPTDYPFKPPRMRLLTKIFHCNWNSAGAECLDITGDQWSPALKVSKVILCYGSMMADPNPEDALRVDIGEIYVQDRPLHDVMAQNWTRKYAGGTFQVVVLVDAVQPSDGVCIVTGKTLSEDIHLRASSSDRWCDLVFKYHQDTGQWLSMRLPDGRGVKIAAPVTCLDAAEDSDDEAQVCVHATC
eukprot:TRINITY_DN17973_c0_g1_i1.p1 TRINITY_DN17973_c0_g1~~TRINITY_DN17973_c0_g1_i1.p1  ORF type:complete len:239 (+),score=16.10 TRINITY_DN17973_c0_g1_i1:91-807(+)